MENLSIGPLQIYDDTHENLEQTPGFKNAPHGLDLPKPLERLSARRVGQVVDEPCTHGSGRR